MNVLILGSRIYAPLTDVDRELQALPSDATVTAFGSSDVCKRAMIAAESLGLAARNVTLSRSRQELVEAARRPDAHVWLFCCRQPGSTELTEGIGQIASYLASQGISARRFDTPLPGRVCLIITKLRQAVDATLAASQEHRRIVITNRALKIATEALDERDRYEAKLAAGMHVMTDDDAATDKWLRWCAAYEALSNALEDAKALLTPGKAAAA